MKKRKSVKGMTLVEIVISMFVFSVAAVIMISVARVSINMTRHSNQVNRKTTIETPYAESGNTAAGYVEDDNMKIDVSVATPGGNKSVSIAAKSYSTKQVGDADARASQSGSYDIEYVGIDLGNTNGAGIWVAPTT